MKNINKHVFFVISYLLIFIFILIDKFNLVILLSLICSILFLIANFYLKEKSFIYYSIIALTYSLVIASLFVNNLTIVKVFDPYFFSNLFFLLIAILSGLITDLFKTNLIMGVRTRYSLQYPEIWHKSNSLYARLNIASILPIGMLTFYVGGSSAFLAIFFIFLIFVFVVLIYDDHIGRRLSKEKIKEEDKNLNDDFKLKL